MESTSLQTPDDALSYIAPIGEFVPYTCNVTASHPTIRTRVRSLQRRWLLSCLSEIGQTLLLFSCCLACRLTSPHLSPPRLPNTKAGTEYGQPAQLHLTLGHGLKHPTSALRSSHTADLIPRYACTDSCPCSWLPVQRHRECQSKLMLLSSESFPLAVPFGCCVDSRLALQKQRRPQQFPGVTRPGMSALTWTPGKHPPSIVPRYLYLGRRGYSRRR